MREFRISEIGVEKTLAKAQKLAEQLQMLQRQLAEQEAAAAQAQRLATLTKMATKAGIDPDLIEYLDTSKLDLANEKAVNEVLAKLAPRAPATRPRA
jgi:DNA-binding protein H-NS